MSVPAWLQASVAEFLRDEQRQQLDVLFDRIWPADPARHVPGAVEVLASRFVSRLLARTDETYHEIPAWRELYPAALKALDGAAQARFGAPLIALHAPQTDELLAALEAGTLQGLPPPLDAKVLFKTLRRHCIQGCLSDPRWGGNDGGRMWRALGYLQPAEDL